MALIGLSCAALGLSLSARPLTMLTSPFRMPAPVCMVSIDSTIKQDAEAVFSVVDVDGDGTVTKEELMSHLTASGYKAEAVEKIFEKLDIDNSGCLSLEELIAGFYNYTPLRKAPGFGNYNEQFKELIHADADALFNAIDGNNDGEITDAELRVHLRQFSNFSDAAITNIFSMLDTNANGGVDRTELRSAFVRSSALRQAIGQGPNFK